MTKGLSRPVPKVANLTVLDSIDKGHLSAMRSEILGDFFLLSLSSNSAPRSVCLVEVVGKCGVPRLPLEFVRLHQFNNSGLFHWLFGSQES